MSTCAKGLKIGLAIAVLTVLTSLTGCVGYAGGGGVVVGGPGFYGDFFDRGHDVHAFRDRGVRSRGVAHGRR